MTEKLKSCPFCGGDKIGTSNEDRTWHYHCQECDATSYYGYETEAEAITAWNTRADGWQPISTAQKDERIIYQDGPHVGTAVFIGGSWWDGENKMKPDFWMRHPDPQDDGIAFKMHGDEPYREITIEPVQETETVVCKYCRWNGTYYQGADGGVCLDCNGTGKMPAPQGKE
jgi:Lar family restriction alleviation protein